MNTIEIKTAFVSELTNKLNPTTIQVQNKVSGSLDSSTSLPTILFSNIISTLLTVIGIAAVLSLIYGGFLYLTAGANPEQAETGKRVIIYTVIAIVVVIASYAIYKTVTSL